MQPVGSDQGEETRQECRTIRPRPFGNQLADGQPGVDRPILEALIEKGDRYLHLSDFQDYAAMEDHVEHAFVDRHTWHQKAVLNVARMGYFSSDRTIREYARDIWGLREDSDRHA